MRSFPILFLLLVFAFTAQGYSQEEPLLLDDVIRQARENNPEIQSARQRYLSVKTRITQSGNLPDPVVSYERDTANKMNMWGVSQEVPFWGRLYLRSKISKTESQSIEQAQYRAKELEVISNTRKAYFMLFVADKSIQVYNETVSLLNNMAKAVEARYITGTGSRGDLLRLQIELTKMENMLKMLQQEKETSQAMLNILMNNNPEEAIGDPVQPEKLEFSYSVEELQKLAAENSPELKGAKYTVEKSRLSASLSKREYLPSLMLGYKNYYMSDSGDKAGDLSMLSLNVPLWFWKQRAMFIESKQDLRMAEYEYKNLENMTLYGIKSLYTKVKTYQQLINQYNTAMIPQAKQLMDVSRESYIANRTDFIDLLDSQRTLLNLNLELYQYIGEYWKNLAELERAVGKEL